jgi:hypothetical protein
MIASCLKNVVLFWCKRQVAAVPNKQKLVSSVNIFPPVHYVLMFLCQFKFLRPITVPLFIYLIYYYTPAPRRGRGVYCFTSVRPSVQDIFLSNCWWQKSDIWSQASYRYTILWVAFLDPSDSYFLFADLVGFYTHWTYMHIFEYNILQARGNHLRYVLIVSCVFNLAHRISWWEGLGFQWRNGVLFIYPNMQHSQNYILHF